jgi:hypothetical protein
MPWPVGCHGTQTKGKIGAPEQPNELRIRIASSGPNPRSLHSFNGGIAVMLLLPAALPVRH